MPDVEIEVDGLLVPVDADEYQRDPERVVESVRTARAALSLGEDVPEADDYHAILRGDR